MRTKSNIPYIAPEITMNILLGSNSVLAGSDCTSSSYLADDEYYNYGGLD